ncbi:IS1096 element passenger TnpR family protein [Thermophilibacter provencensis]|uniref:Plasmid pRiA4b Orf3-like domain-containing protein n=1 Tax=Thermophilibacter provencensis TaxID=1852386 RepID=A0ABT7V4J9_9ACTN|nr:hypothetical protein [Thermophilibacter provencensis]MDM8271528.1 hypothetical protein [Thermophilibacter provencensis]
MLCNNLNDKLGCLFVLALAYLNMRPVEGHFGTHLSPQTYDPNLLERLQSYGLVRFAPQGEIIQLTDEGAREARGVIKYLQLQLGPQVGASLQEIQRAYPSLYAEEAAFGAGPLTTTELVYSLAGIKTKATRTPTLTPTALANPPASYGRDRGDDRSFALKVSLAISEGRSYYYPRHECWRRVLVPAGLTFLDLHLVIQLVFCWKDLQPFGFLLNSRKKNFLIGEKEVCGEIAQPKTGKRSLVEERASKLTLAEVFPRTRAATYRYGVEGDWTHLISLESTERGMAELGPQLLDGAGDAPPEWARTASEFIDFRNSLYENGRTLIKALSDSGEKGYQPFEYATTRARLAGFEDERARWEQRLIETSRASEGN